MGVYVLTPTIRGREHLLAEAEASVREQSTQADAHLVFLDEHRVGPAAVRNLLLADVPAEQWVSFLDDDDLWHPHHLATLLDVQHQTGADVVYSLADITGRPGWDPQQDTFDVERLRRGNYIPLNGIVRAGLAREAGGFPEDTRQYEDWGFWLNLLDAGATFACTGARTWNYRFGNWDSRSKEIWDGRR